MKNHSILNSVNRQQGLALAVSLILLLAITLIAIASMNGARLEITMAGLMQQEEVALRRAERTLIAAETNITTLVSTTGPHNFAAENDGYYTAADDLNAAVNNWTFGKINGPVNTNNSIDDDDHYVIEYLGEQNIPGESEAENPDTEIAGAKVYVYRTTTRSTSGKGIRLVQSIYTTIDPP